MDELSDEEKVIVARARRVQFFLSQNFNVAERFTGQPGSYVPVEETVKGFKQILEGKYDDYPEDAFRSVGRIEEVVEKAKKMGFAPDDQDTDADESQLHKLQLTKEATRFGRNEQCSAG